MDCATIVARLAEPDEPVLDEVVVRVTEENGVTTAGTTNDESRAVGLTAEEVITGVILGATGIDGITPLGTEFEILGLINVIIEVFAPWPLLLHWPRLLQLHWPTPLQ